MPGAFGTDFTPGTGIRIAPGSRLVMQIHYNLEAIEAVRPDRSLVELKLDDAVQRRAVYAPLVDASWILSPRFFRIPAKRKRIVHSFVADPRELFRITTGMDFSRGFVVNSVLLHMHRLGKRGSVEIQRTSGARETLLSVPRWDFNWQREYHLASAATVAPGDRLAIRCEHSNPTRQTKTWGENSSDEMCIAFLYVSEP